MIRLLHPSAQPPTSTASAEPTEASVRRANVVLGRALVQQCVRKGALLPRGGAHVIITEGQAKAALVSCSVPPAVVIAFKQTLDSPVMPLLNPEACFAASQLGRGLCASCCPEFGGQLRFAQPAAAKSTRPQQGSEGYQLDTCSCSHAEPCLEFAARAVWEVL